MKRAIHNLSNYKLATFNMGELVPVGLTEVVRGDSIFQKTRALTRVQPLLAPIYHPVHQKIHHWFVPHRLVWEDYEDFITGGPDGEDATVHPTITVNNAAVGSLFDYMGIPPSVASNRSVSALPIRGYSLIWNKYYRDQDLQTELTISKASGVDSTTNTTLQSACWNKDYFTTSRLEPQKGPEVIIPLLGEAPVLGLMSDTQVFGTAGASGYDYNGAQTFANAMTSNGASGNNTLYVEGTAASGGTPNIRADMTQTTGFDLVDLRVAAATQRFMEARSKFGSEYVDYLNYYGIKSSDARLQRPEYLGGGRDILKFSEVLQTSPDASGGTSGSAGVGDLYGHGIGSTASSPFKKFFEEDGYIISLMVVNPVTMYVQGIPRTWSRTTKEDYFQKEMAHIGQQQVLNKEVYSGHTTPEGVFGYQDRYDEYRRTENTIAGEFRTTLNYWHMARIFSSDPALNADFVKANPTNRVYASTATDQLYVYIRHDIRARRLVPQFGTSFLE